MRRVTKINYDRRMLSGHNTLARKKAFDLRAWLFPTHFSASSAYLVTTVRNQATRHTPSRIWAVTAHVALAIGITAWLSSLGWALAYTKDLLAPLAKESWLAQQTVAVKTQSPDPAPLEPTAAQGQPKTRELALPALHELAVTPAFQALPGDAQDGASALELTAASDTTLQADADTAQPQENQSASTLTLREELAEDPSWRSISVRSGDTLAAIFNRYGLNSNELHEIINLNKESRQLRNLQPGQMLFIKSDDEGVVQEIIKQLSLTHDLRITRDTENPATNFVSTMQTRELERRVAVSHGEISTTLYESGRKNGLSFDLLNQLVKLFAWDVDFALDIQPGDHFAVIYESFYENNEEVKTGEILAAEFVNNGNVFRAVRFTDTQGMSGYYTPEGNSLEKAFLRTPVKVGYVTSHFSSGRYHPSLHEIKAHNGVDYGAPKGTPVFATGRGKVEFLGWRNGYGKTIEISHGDHYSTVYGHLSRFAKELQAGDRVEQGQEIGYVGSTGLATGPHLHYEFQIDGVHKNPLTVKLPNSLPIAPEYLHAFQEASTPLLAQLDQQRQVAASAQNAASPTP